MKKTVRLIAAAVLTLCLVGFALDRVLPTNAVHAASQSAPALASANPVDKQPVPLTKSTQPEALIVGLVCVLFGIAAISPLLIDRPATL